MRKTFTFLMLACVMFALTYGCSDDYYNESDEPTTRASEGNGDDDIPYGLYYDEESGMWLLPADDLEDVEPSGADPGIVTMSMGGFTPTPSLPPGDFTPGKIIWVTIITHNYLKIWPKDEEQIEELFAMENVVIQYHSFDSVPLSTSVMQALGLVNSAPSASLARYSETIEMLDTSDDILEPAKVVYMPVLYAMWPRGLSIPEDMDYEITGQRTEEVSYETPSTGTPPTGGVSGGQGGTHPRITVKAWDSTLGRYMNICNAWIRVRTANNRIEQGYTDANGIFQCKNVYTESMQVHITVRWDHKHFWLLNNSRVAEYVVSQKIGGSVCEVKIPECHNSTIFRAAEYWFEYAQQHRLSTSCGSSGKVKIFANDYQNSGSSNGQFYTYWSWSRLRVKTAIKVWRNSGRKWHEIFCTTLHEMGHGSMYARQGKIGYAKTGGRIKEGWASFTGWYMTNLVYYNWRYTSPKGWNLGDTRQKWNKISAGEYSPMFIDLYDTENQRTNNPTTYQQNYLPHNYPDDNIRNVPPEKIESLAFTSKKYHDYKETLFYWLRHGYYTEQQLRDYLSVYDDIW